MIKNIGTYAFRIVLQPTMKTHPVFYFSVLERAAENLLERQVIPLPAPIEVDGEEEYEVNKILDTQIY